MDGPVEAERLQCIVDEVFRGLGLGPASDSRPGAAVDDGHGASPRSGTNGAMPGWAWSHLGGQPGGSRLVASASLAGGSEVIALTLTCRDWVAAELASRMVGRSAGDLCVLEVTDALGEIANILAGHVRASVSELSLGLPVVEAAPVGSGVGECPAPSPNEVLCAVQVATAVGRDDEEFALEVRLERVGRIEMAEGSDGLL